MAAEEHNSTRRHVLGAAAALPVLAFAGFPTTVIASRGAARQSSPDHALWNRRLAHYRRLHARWKAEAESGAFRAANDRYYSERAALSARFGSWEKARKSRIGKPLCTAAFARVAAAEDAYYDDCTAPMHRALTRLVQTPATDLPALLAKIEIICEHEPDLLDDAPLNAFEMLREDVVRLASR